MRSRLLGCRLGRFGCGSGSRFGLGFSRRCRCGSGLRRLCGTFLGGGLVGVEACRDNGDAHFVAIGVVEGKTPDDLRFGVNGLAHELHGSGGLLQADIGRAGNVDQCTVGAFDAFLQQRRADGQLGGLGGAILAPRGTDAEQCGAGATQNGGDIGEINVNVGVGGNEVGNALHAGQQCAVGGLERIHDGDGAVGQFKQAIVRNDDERIDFLTQVLDAEFGGGGTLRAFEGERTGDHGDGEGPLLVSRTGDDRACAGTGAAALTAGDEHHIGALQRLFDIGLMVLCGLGALLRVGACAEPTAGLVGQGDLDVGVRAKQILGIGVDSHKFNVLQTFSDHAVYGVTTCTTDTDNLDIGLVVQLSLGVLAHVWLLSLHGYA